MMGSMTNLPSFAPSQSTTRPLGDALVGSLILVPLRCRHGVAGRPAIRVVLCSKRASSWMSESVLLRYGQPGGRAIYFSFPGRAREREEEVRRPPAISRSASGRRVSGRIPTWSY
jgi:hypothetical protein